MFKHGTALTVVACGIVLGGALFLAQHRRPIAVPVASSIGASAPAGTEAKFAFLARQTGNRCGLQPSTLLQMAPRRHLRGSCCDPMNLSGYETQVRALRASAGIWQIPRDPYDVPVVLAQQLLNDDASIHLGSQQTSTYAQAMRMSRLKGPCCCRCWRWYAFRGLSKYLIARRRWPAPPIAALTEQLEGCGGPKRA